MATLEEIKDKEYAKSILNRIQELKHTLVDRNTYQMSPWFNFLEVQKRINNSTYKQKVEKKIVELNKAQQKLKDEEELPSTYKIANGCFIITAVFVGLVVFMLLSILLDGKYEGIKGGLLLLLITLPILALTMFWKKKYKMKDGQKYKSQEHKQYAEEVLKIEDEIANLNIEITKEQTAYNECLQTITLDNPEWELKIKAITQNLPQ